MVEKLALPFPLLSDPRGEGAIKPYGVWHEGQTYAKPAVVLVAADRSEALRQVGEDLADRLPEEALVASVRALGVPATMQQRPTPGTPRAGERAVDLAWLPAYFRGAKSAVMSLAARVPEARSAAKIMSAEYDRFLAALKWLEGTRRRDVGGEAT